MAGPSWLVDPNRIATKIRSASGAYHPENISWKSNPTKCCPNCHYIIDNSDVVDEWPGLPRGVKFDPSDQEIIWHLLAKVGDANSKPHPFINEFIPTVDEEDGICYTHPQNLPGVKQDGSVSHFFHRAIKAYNTGTRKRRKIHADELGDVRWHKTGKTKPVSLDGVQKGCKKIMVLYVSAARGGKAEKTNWVMHQYHLGTGEDEKEGQYVISKVSYQQQQVKMTEKIEDDNPEGSSATIVKEDPVTPKSVTPEPPYVEPRFLTPECRQESAHLEPPYVEPRFLTTECRQGSAHPEPPHGELRLLTPECRRESALPHTQLHNPSCMEDVVETTRESNDPSHDNKEENHSDPMEDKGNDDEPIDEGKWWENESQFLLSSQQLVEGLSICDELLQSQSPNRDETGIGERPSDKPRLSDYAQLGPEDLKRDLLECQNFIPDPVNIELDTPPDFRLSQLEFESQDSYIAWGGSVRGGGGKQID